MKYIKLFESTESEKEKIKYLNVQGLTELQTNLMWEFRIIDEESGRFIKLDYNSLGFDGITYYDGNKRIGYYKYDTYNPDDFNRAKNWLLTGETDKDKVTRILNQRKFDL